jgi:hypothetical protein
MEFKKPLSGIAGNTSSFEHFLQAPEGSFFFFAVHCAVTDCISVSLWAGIFSFTKVLFPLSVSLLSLLQNIFQKILQASGAHGTPVPARSADIPLCNPLSHVVIYK